MRRAAATSESPLDAAARAAMRARLWSRLLLEPLDDEQQTTMLRLRLAGNSDHVARVQKFVAATSLPLALESLSRTMI